MIPGLLGAVFTASIIPGRAARRAPVPLGEPVNTAAGPQDGRPPAAGRRVMSTGVGVPFSREAEDA
jgi:hypothetical protein